MHILEFGRGRDKRKRKKRRTEMGNAARRGATLGTVAALGVMGYNLGTNKKLRDGVVSEVGNRYQHL
jgi:hypothetical protein